MAAQMLKSLKGKVLDDLTAAHKEALKRAPKPTSQAAGADGAPVDKEGDRFANRLAQDRMEGGFGFVMTANSVGDNHFAREQAAALKRADEQKRALEAAALSDFEASKARAAAEALDRQHEVEPKAAKSFVWGAASLKVKRAPGPVRIEPAEPEDSKAKRQKTATQDSSSDGEEGSETKGDGVTAGTDGSDSGTLAGLGDYSSSSSDSDD